MAATAVVEQADIGKNDGVDAEIRRFTAAHVCDQIDSPESKAAQVIHVADMIDETWTGI